MYQPRTPGYCKSDPVMRWALPDRVFFACGACHILAHAFLKRWALPEAQAVWIKPNAGFIGHHVVVDGREWLFDYHGYCSRSRFLAHVWRGARRRWPGWDATLIPLPASVLISEAASRAYDGLWLREPGQFLHDPTARAQAYLNRFPPPPRGTRPMSEGSKDCCSVDRQGGFPLRQQQLYGLGLIGR